MREQALAGTRPILPKYRPQELFAVVPEVEAGETVADRIADLEDQIADARRERRRREAERLERIRERSTGPRRGGRERAQGRHTGAEDRSSPAAPGIADVAISWMSSIG